MIRKLILLTCALFFSRHIEAQIRPTGGEFGVEATLLYFRPLVDFSYYATVPAVNTVLTVQGTRYANFFDWHGGVSVEGIYVFCNENADLRLQWTHLQERAIDEVAAGDGIDGVKFFLDPTIAVFTQAQSEAKLQFDAIEFLFGYLPIHRCGVLSLHAGLQYARITYNETDIFSNPDLYEGEWALKMNGVGPEVGLLCKYLLPWCTSTPKFYLDAKAQCGAVIGKISSHTVMNNLADPADRNAMIFDIVAENTYRVVPFWEFGLGMSAQCTCRCLSVEVEVGYQFIQYHKALRAQESATLPVFSDWMTLFSDLILHGVYVSAGIGF